MPWRQTVLMDERVRFALSFESGRFSMSELCSEYGISRKTGYKWLARFREGGVAGLADHSRAPHTNPHRMPEAVEEYFRQERGTHPHWGPRKLLDRLSKSPPAALQEMLDQGHCLPAASTVGE